MAKTTLHPTSLLGRLLGHRLQNPDTLPIAHTNRTRRGLFGELPARFLEAYGLPPLISENPYFRVNLVYNFVAQLDAHHGSRNRFSWNANREMRQIVNVGMKCFHQKS